MWNASQQMKLKFRNERIKGKKNYVEIIKYIFEFAVSIAMENVIQTNIGLHGIVI